MFLTALRSDAKKKVNEVGWVDILVGIPSYNNQTTIAHVVEAAGEGLRRFYPNKRALIVVSDGGSVDDTREMAEAVQLPIGVERLVTIYRGVPGKGSSLRAVFEIAEALEPKAVLVVDADLRSITPDWVRNLIDPILSGQYQFVSPYYNRYKFDGTITKLIAYPLVRTFFGYRLRQPIGGDFGFSGDLVKYFARQHVWETDIAKYGIDVWLTIKAIEQNVTICQARLGAKIHTPKDPATLGPMFRQVVGTLFALIEEYRDAWRNIKESKEVSVFGSVTSVHPLPLPVSLNKLIDDFRYGYEHFGSLWQKVLSLETFEGVTQVLKKLGRKIDFSAELWAKVVYDFAVSFMVWKTDKQKLISTMTPLYYGRTAAFIDEVKDLSDEEADNLVEEQASLFESLRPYFFNKTWPVVLNSEKLDKK
jgi:hypothetical protein